MESTNQVWSNPCLWQLWCWCLKKASFVDKWISIKSGKGSIDVYVRRGQFIFGRYSAAEDLNVKPSTIRDRIRKLQRLGFIDIAANKQYSVVSICNYNQYVDCKNNITTSKTKGKTKNKDKKDKDKEDMTDFENLWQDYPLKVGKKYAVKAYKKTVISKNDKKDIAKALNNYLYHLENNIWKHPKNGSTWFNDWKDWVDWQEPKQINAISERGQKNIETGKEWIAEMTAKDISHDKK